MLKSRSAKNQNNKPQRIIYIVFSLLVLFSVIGLDFISWKKEKRSYFFSVFSREKKAAMNQETLEQVVLKNLTLNGISSESVHQFRDTQGALHLMVDLAEGTYLKLESVLESEFAKINAPVLGKEEQLGEEKNYYLWQVGEEKEKGLIILFSVEKEETKEPVPLRKEPRNRAAIIVDDMGYSLNAIREICSFQKPLTISILPFSPFANETAQIAHQNSLEVILHLPLESINNREENNIEGLIHSQMTEEEVQKTVEINLEQVPYIKGANNHMGSKITANEAFMNIIIQSLKNRNLFFVDSRTTTRSIAYEIAQTMQVPSAYRHVFLDGKNQEDYIKGKLIELFRLARRNGKAVGICHPLEETLKTLRENLHLASEYNIELVFVSQIVE